jgi:capsid protein
MTFDSTNSGQVHDAAQVNRLASRWSTRRLPDAQQTWFKEGDSLATRGWRLLCNASLANAMVRCVQLHLVGTGLDLISQYQADDAANSTDAERDVRRRIRLAIARACRGSSLDAGGLLTREQLLSQIVISGWVAGESFAVRTWSPAATFGTKWRVIDPSRVETPADKLESDNIIDGIEVDADQRPVALWIRKRAKINGFTYAKGSSADYDRVAWYDDAGEARVIHYVPFPDRPGTIRGISAFAPVALRIHHLDQATNAHVAGKRQQASLPLAVPSDNPAEASKAYQQARDDGYVDDAVNVLFYQRGDAPSFPQVSYQGADFAAFDEVMVRQICAAWGFPWQVVLAQLTNGNMASSQAALDQFERAITVYQDVFIEQVARPIDRSVLRESAARGQLGAVDPDLDRLTLGDYRRPRRPDANRLRTREAAARFIEIGGSFTTAHGEIGSDFEDEIRQRAADESFAAAQGIDLHTAPEPAAAPAQPDDSADDQDADDAADQAQNTDTDPDAALLSNANSHHSQAAIPSLGSTP